MKLAIGTREDIPILLHALRRVIDKTGADWTPEFVISRIANGSAGLYRLVDSGAVTAYFVVEMLTGYKATLNVWIMVGSAKARDAGRIIALIDDLARAWGARDWKMESPRRGWTRILRGYATDVRTVYERKMP